LSLSADGTKKRGSPAITSGTICTQAVACRWREILIRNSTTGLKSGHRWTDVASRLYTAEWAGKPAPDFLGIPPMRQHFDEDRFGWCLYDRGYRSGGGLA
jgi:hypothetical protein